MLKEKSVSEAGARTRATSLGEGVRSKNPLLLTNLTPKALNKWKHGEPQEYKKVLARLRAIALNLPPFVTSAQKKMYCLLNVKSQVDE